MGGSCVVSPHHPSHNHIRSNIILAIGFATLTTSLIATQSSRTLILLATDGAVAVLLVTAIICAGGVPARFLLPDPASLRWRFLTAAGCGLGCVATIVLELGVFGALNRTLVFSTIAFVALFGLWTLCSVRSKSVPAEDDVVAGDARWLWLLVSPCAALAVLVAVVPAGFLWREEGFGYDILEYHLQLPKEYYLQGLISYTPHNVYGGFPSNIEMLYLLSMLLYRDPFEGAALAQWVNLLLGVLFVGAAYVAGREHSATTGIVAAVLAASLGWLTYLSGVAYVENGMLMFGMMSTAAIVRATKIELSLPARYRMLLFAGLMAGFSCGCKYTAFVMIAIPLGVFTIWVIGDRMSRIRVVLGFSSALLVGFSPWLIKNAILTGNPVFPLLGSVFTHYPPGWGAAEAIHFAECHRPVPQEAGALARISSLWARIFADPDQRLGALVILLGICRLLTKGRQRIDTGLGMMAGVQLLMWMTFTHLYARFAVPLAIPLVLLGARFIGTVRSSSARHCVNIILGAGVLVNGAMSARLYWKHVYIDGQKQAIEGADYFFLQGCGGGFDHLSVINNELPVDARILLIGDAKAFYFQRYVDYTVVFNRQPFVDAVRKADRPEEVVDWLVRRGYSHVFVHWDEVARLRASQYGFPIEVTPLLFDGLVEVGLRKVHTFERGDGGGTYGELYQVPVR